MAKDYDTLERRNFLIIAKEYYTKAQEMMDYMSKFTKKYNKKLAKDYKEQSIKVRKCAIFIKNLVDIL